LVLIWVSLGTTGCSLPGKTKSICRSFSKYLHLLDEVEFRDLHMRKLVLVYISSDSKVDFKVIKLYTLLNFISWQNTEDESDHTNKQFTPGS
jgi:hypothetical protein